MTDKPIVVCLCGSTKFKQAYIHENARLTRMGQIVLSVGVFGHSHESARLSEGVKCQLDELHLRKIDLADYVYILDVGGYIGDSTRREMNYALDLGKPVEFLSEAFPDYKEPVDEVAVERDALVEDVDRFRQWVNDLQSGMYVNCVYCGHHYGPSNEVLVSVANALKAHVEQCPEHPMSALKKERDALRVEVSRFTQCPSGRPGCWVRWPKDHSVTKRVLETTDWSKMR